MHPDTHRLQNEAPLVSVTILTRDRHSGLKKCIGSLVESSYSNVEIIIVDNSSDSTKIATQEFLSDLNTDCSITYISTKPMGFAKLRQLAIDQSRGQFIMSIDDDCIADVDAISHIVNRFRSDERIGIIGGNLTNVGFSEQEISKGRGKIGPNGKYYPVHDPATADVFGSANMSMRRSAVDVAGGYDSFFRGGLEEADLTLSIREHGYEVVYEPKVKITHYHSPARFRSIWRNLDMLRLYMLFKHFSPTKLSEWLSFLNSEYKLLRDQLKILSRYIKEGKSIRYSLLSLFKLLLAWLTIPYIYLRARLKRR